MITKNNLKFCFDSLKESEIKKVMDSRKDYVSFWLHIFNAGGFATVKPVNYSEKKELKHSDNGMLLLDKDDFLRLFKESESVNPFLIEYL
jgi:hypothetical protein